MQPSTILQKWLSKHACSEHYLFRTSDLRGLFPGVSDSTFKVLLTRAVHSQLLQRICRGIYYYPEAAKADGMLLFHVAALLRAQHFNYLSLETILSEHGIISQIPVGRITLMSSGRSSIVKCGSFGTIEFVHTAQLPEQLISQLHYDQRRGLWCANISLAIRDMKRTGRNLDLINWDELDESIR